MPAGSPALRIIVLEGDQTGQELLEQALRVLDPAVSGWRSSSSTTTSRWTTAAAPATRWCWPRPRAMRDCGYGIKAATITPEGADDVGSPNRILREAVDGRVIIRAGRRIPGVAPVAGVHHPIAVVRMAVGDAYGAQERREPSDGDEVALRTERVQRSGVPRRRRVRLPHRARSHARVYGGPKWTVSPVYEGMLKEELDAAAERYPGRPYQPQLIDVTYAGLVGGAASDAPLVIPALNRDGDCLSELVLSLYGSIAGAESVLLSLDEDYRTRVVMTEAPHGTAPGARGQEHRQPDGDDPRRRGAAALHGRGRITAGRDRPRARCTRRCWRRPRPGSGRRTSAATRPRRRSPTRWSRACGPSSRSGPA